jgi:hypothetical protein
MAVWLCLGAGPALAAGPQGDGGMFLGEADVMGVIGQLEALHGAAERARIEHGVRQAARLWTEADGPPGEFARFAAEQFRAGADLDALFERFEAHAETLGGHLNSLQLALRRPMDEERGPLQPADLLFAQLNLGGHLLDDLFQTRLAFVALLNFRLRGLPELLAEGPKLSRRQWAEARLAQGFQARVPASVYQAINSAETLADHYIANYNIHLDRVLGPDGQAMFRDGLKLISHWGLRDELKASYADPNGLARQRMIQTIMLRIVNQEIPAAVIGNPGVKWDPLANLVDGQASPREADRRFQQLLDVFRARRLEDPFHPAMPTHMDRRFLRDREIPEAELEKLLVSVLEAPAGKAVAELVARRLGRPLEAFDIWYDGFKARGALDERELDRVVRERYPTLEAFQAALPDILGKLGFAPDTARFLAERIQVDPSRGAGHAWGPQMRSEKAHLRTRVPAEGMNYKGFNIAMHELGHNVEQVFSLYRLDHTLLAGVPNTAFTEGFAFVFQKRDLEVLGLARPDPEREALDALDDFWATREIAGVGLVDMRVWRWMYAHPEAGPAELREAVVQIAREVWNQYYAPVFGVRDTPLLAIYSHMISNALYLPDYPLGHIIAFQVEDYFKTHPLGQHMERMCALGRIAPDLWMKQAVGAPISSRPLCEAALKAVGKVR